MSLVFLLRVLCIFWEIVLYQICLANIISVCSLSYSLDNVFHRAEFFFSDVQLINCSFYGSCLWYFKSHHNNQGHLDFLPLSSRTFTVLHFTFRSMVHYGFYLFVKFASSFFLFFFACEWPVVTANTFLPKRQHFFPWIFLVMLSDIIDYIYVGLCLGSVCVPLIYLSILLPITTLSWLL